MQLQRLGGMSRLQRDHLFISYAWEDGDLADWLTLKLTAEGYLVWCDRFKLLGGESYPQDIDRAIKERTFRLLALLSRHSLQKPNPLKERTLAVNLSRERGEDFLIPLNVDGLRPTDLPWMLSDLTYIPFHSSWAEGFTQLLTKLDTLNTPRPLVAGKQAVVDWFAARDTVNDAPERLWSNLLEFTDLPSTLLRITLAEPVPPEASRVWPHYLESQSVLWAFEGPEQSVDLELLDLEEVDWSEPYDQAGLKLPDVVTILLKQHLRLHCLSRGMHETVEGQHLYFPPNLLPGNRLSFATYDGTHTWVRAVGERAFRVSATECEKTRYHLSPTFRPTLRKYARPAIQVQMRVYLTDTESRPLPPLKARRRRKAICKHWWNHEWLLRMLAVASWMANGAPSVNLARTSACRIVLAGQPIQLEAPVGIDESRLKAAAMEDDEAELSDEPETQDEDDAESVEGEADG